MPGQIRSTLHANPGTSVVLTCTWCTRKYLAQRCCKPVAFTDQSNPNWNAQDTSVWRRRPVLGRRLCGSGCDVLHFPAQSCQFTLSALDLLVKDLLAATLPTGLPRWHRRRNPAVLELARLLAMLSRFSCCAVIALAAVYKERNIDCPPSHTLDNSVEAIRLNSLWKVLSARRSISAWRCTVIMLTTAEIGFAFEPSSIPCRMENPVAVVAVAPCARSKRCPQLPGLCRAGTARA